MKYYKIMVDSEDEQIKYDGDCLESARAVSYADIHEGTTTIQADAFEKSEITLKEVILPSTLEYIGRGAFENCDMLTNITFKGNQETFIGDKAFKGTAISHLVLPRLDPKSGYGIFSDSSELVSVDCRNADFIPEECFFNCKNLEDVNFGRVKEIYIKAFYNCNLPEEIHIPATVRKICAGAFEGNPRLKRIVFDGNKLPMFILGRYDRIADNNVDLYWHGKELYKTTVDSKKDSFLTNDRDIFYTTSIYELRDFLLGRDRQYRVIWIPGDLCLSGNDTWACADAYYHTHEQIARAMYTIYDQRKSGFIYGWMDDLWNGEADNCFTFMPKDSAVYINDNGYKGLAEDEFSEAYVFSDCIISVKDKLTSEGKRFLSLFGTPKKVLEDTDEYSEIKKEVESFETKKELNEYGKAKKGETYPINKKDSLSIFLYGMYDGFTVTKIVPTSAGAEIYGILHGIDGIEDKEEHLSYDNFTRRMTIGK